MANFFQKVDWTECTGDVNAKCPRFVNKERLPAYKAKCSDCGSKAREVTRPDMLKVGIIGGIFVLLLGGGGMYVRAKVIDGLKIPVIGGGDKPKQPEDSRPSKTSEIIWTVEIEKGSDRTRLTNRDFAAEGNTFRSRQDLRAGDRLRFDVTYTANWLYAFYRGETEASRLGSHSGGKATLPTNDGWFRMDDRPGTEEFILVAAADTLPSLDPLTGAFDPAVLDQAVRKLESGAGATVIRVRVPHR